MPSKRKPALLGVPVPLRAAGLSAAVAALSGALAAVKWAEIPLWLIAALLAAIAAAAGAAMVLLGVWIAVYIFDAANSFLRLGADDYPPQKASRKR